MAMIYHVTNNELNSLVWRITSEAIALERNTGLPNEMSDADVIRTMVDDWVRFVKEPVR